ncbi:bifunctional alpha/beta hydrolase/class I SAM-dependent methyltransferase [Phocoenobacter skyensis]|uniref:Lysophospholipase, alpha-beta hydrolase superfamily n=1 Tax=Phocoenobacter skyensis TaxID=97481 RepID=A0A1H7VMF7_9PAST|nr:bifunctional alpha/beta hydrolase/class I SAM-dependent methyltransferase [Pasteurella skyensis]MDP8184819.1 bifunctional alpha/beta hydrolase/class I SAM-dependent methyltransferase [Pasteurella skyensis]SEM10426.1 Lysophospholipase, alpha-beta hydrolase superfamily [Pasteurella skyensis]
MSTTMNFYGYNNRELLARKWENTSDYNQKVIIILHRGHEHSQRLDEIANYESFSAYKKYSYDYRGHGAEKGEPCYEFMDLVRDLDLFIKFVKEDAKVELKDIFIIANSVSGVVTSTWLHDYGLNIAGVALVAPAFKIKLYVPFAKQGLALALKVKPKLHIKSYVKSKVLTHDIKEQQKYNNDPLISPDIPASQLVTLLNTAERVVKDASMITVPTLVLSAEKDYVVSNAMQGDFYANLSSKYKKFVQLDNFYHGVLYETERDIALKEISDFMEQSFSLTEEINYLEKLIDIREVEKNKVAYGSLCILDKVRFAIQRFFINQFGHLSNGITIGKKYGFDSGVTLDYIYQNKANGTNFFGKFMDKTYLSAIGWRGIRQRKVNLENMLEYAIENLKQENVKVNILDIAGGPAKYLIQMAKKYEDVDILVRDYQAQNIEKGREYVKEYNLTNISYEQADAFDKKSYENMEFKPNIVVISGVFELFNENDTIQNAIDGVSAILQKGDTLIFTNQPYHPQLSEISNVLMNHQKQKWTMRLRSEYEINKLFENAGFEVQEMLIDNDGIFTVTRAKKV